jgi:hypothetical protein
MSLPQPVFDTPPEPFAAPFPETECDPREDRPGVLAFRDFVLRHQGGGVGYISRPCDVGGPSGHHAGRAWDWMISAAEPAQKARADELVGWLLANDAEMFRRAGLRYLIWNKRQFSSSPRGPSGQRAWKAYDGYDTQGRCTSPGGCRDPHTSHVHFSFSKEGAAGQTSFYRWLAGETLPGTPPPKAPNPFKPRSASSAYAVVGLALGLGAIYGGRRLRRR